MFGRSATVPSSSEAARALLEQMGAPHRLLRHVELVSEAGEQLLGALRELGVTVDESFVRVGILLHDTGKIIHPEELTEPGAKHEGDGESALLARGVSPALARVCRSHGRWQDMECTLEELLIALADKLWKGVRRPDLESRVMDSVAKALGRDRWGVFLPLDGCFERIAAEGDARLQRSLG